MSRVLVTGGAGFVGSHLVDALLAAGRRCGSSTTSTRSPIPPGEPPAHLAGRGGPAGRRPAHRRGRRARRSTASTASSTSAGSSATASRWSTSARRSTPTPGGTATLLEARDRAARSDPAGRRRLVDGRLRRGLLPLRRARRSSTPGLRPRERSSGSAAGSRSARSTAATATSSRCRCARTRPLRPVSVYGISKRDTEELALVLGEAYGFEAVALRYLNVYGPRQALANPYTGVAAIFSARLLGGRAPRVFEDGGADPRPRPRLRRRRGDPRGDGRARARPGAPSTSAPAERIRIAELAARLCELLGPGARARDHRRVPRRRHPPLLRRSRPGARAARLRGEGRGSRTACRSWSSGWRARRTSPSAATRPSRAYAGPGWSASS